MQADGAEGRRGRVLVVDDDPDIRAMVALLLELEGFVVDVAANGLQALHKVRQAAPAVVILDLSMPVMGGEEFLYAWRAGVQTRGVPVIAVTATSKALRAEDLGVEALLPKPFDLDRLVELVQDLVAAPTRLPGPHGRDAQAAELRDVAASLTQVMGVLAGSVELLVDPPTDPEELRAIAAAAAEAAQRGTALMRRLNAMAGALE